jgi:hypothetical protein
MARSSLQAGGSIHPAASGIVFVQGDPVAAGGDAKPVLAVKCQGCVVMFSQAA